MSAFSWLFKTEKRSGVANPSQWLVDFFTGGSTSSGLSVSPDSSLKYSPIWAAVNIIAGTLAGLPLFVFKRLGEDKEKDTKNPIFNLLHTRPNPHMSSLDFRETLTGHVLTWGNGYAEIQRRGDNRVESLWPLRPDLTWPILDVTGELWYEVRPSNGEESRFLPARNVLHIKGFGGNGYQGYSVIEYHREAIGLGQAQQTFGASFFGNNATPGGFLTHPGLLGEQARANLRKEFEGGHRGLDNAHRMGLLEEGLTWTQIGIPARDAQLIESKKFSVADVSRIYQIPLHMLSEMDNSTFSNIEHQGIEFVTLTLARWLGKWEQEIDYKLLPDNRFAEFIIEGLLRGDSAARSAFYREMHNNGFMTINQVLRLENMNGIGPDGDKHFVNSALQLVEDVGKEPEPPPIPPPLPEPEPEMDSFKPLIREFCGRVARRECKAPVKDLGKHEVYISQTFLAPLETMCGLRGLGNGVSSSVSSAIAGAWCEQSKECQHTNWKQLRDERCEMIMGVLRNATNRN